MVMKIIAIRYGEAVIRRSFEFELTNSKYHACAIVPRRRFIASGVSDLHAVHCLAKTSAVLEEGEVNVYSLSCAIKIVLSQLELH